MKQMTKFHLIQRKGRNKEKTDSILEKATEDKITASKFKEEL